jgi:hypothetical protein
MADLTELLERFRRGPELIAEALAGAAGEEEEEFIPAPGKWSLRQIVAHVADTELVMSVRFRMLIAQTNPPLYAFDQNAWAESLGYAGRRVKPSLEMLRRLRAENLSLLRALPPDAFERTGTHSERGTVSLRQLVELSAAHAENHARQIAAVRAAYQVSR